MIPDDENGILWPAADSRAMSKYFKRKAEAAMRERSIARGVPANMCVHKLVDGVNVVDTRLSGLKHSGQDVNVLHRRLWHEFCLGDPDGDPETHAKVRRNRLEEMRKAGLACSADAMPTPMRIVGDPATESRIANLEARLAAAEAAALSHGHDVKPKRSRKVQPPEAVEEVTQCSTS